MFSAAEIVGIIKENVIQAPNTEWAAQLFFHRKELPFAHLQRLPEARFRHYP